MAVSRTGLDRNFQAIRFRHDRAGDVWIVRAVGVVGLVEVKDGCTVLCGSDFEEAPCAVGSLAGGGVAKHETNAIRGILSSIRSRCRAY
jgi:hypothetical protein